VAEVQSDGGRLRWGLLSTAAINQALLTSGHGGIEAVASRSPGRAEAYAREHGIPRAHGSYEDLLADPEVDAVYVPLPNSMHVEWSVRALEAGKHVLCEKPMSRHPEDVERAFDLAEDRGLVVAEAFMWRHHPAIARARELIDAGAIGDVRVFRARFSFVAANAEDIRLSGPLEGGGLMDVGCYCISGLRALAGAEPERVYAEQITGGGGVDVALVATLRFPGDVLGVMDCGLSYAEDDGLEAAGDEGTLIMRDPWHGRESAIEIRGRDRSTERIEIEPANSYALELADFEAAVRGEHPPRLGRDDAVAQARVIAAMYRAAEEGRAVSPAEAIDPARPAGPPGGGGRAA
jgi:D-xylose 1-dehydrogenase (NADP+, D-xylono-1,5-lactone-forming)